MEAWIQSRQQGPKKGPERAQEAPETGEGTGVQRTEEKAVQGAAGAQTGTESAQSDKPPRASSPVDSLPCISSGEWQRERYHGIRLFYAGSSCDVFSFSDYMEKRGELERAGAAIREELQILPEPVEISAEEWTARAYIQCTLTAGPGTAPTASRIYFDDERPRGAQGKTITVYDHEHYLRARDYIHTRGARIIDEAPMIATITAATAREILEAQDVDYLQIDGFTRFSDLLRLRRHDSAIIAAPPGGGKTALGLNLVYGIMRKSPVLYFDMENGTGEILARLLSRHTGLSTQTIGEYRQGSESTRATIERGIDSMLSGARLQIVGDVYEVERVEEIIKRETAGRDEKTVVFIDHGLLMSTSEVKSGANDYERFTRISRHLRRIARECNVTLMILLQMNRESLKAQSVEGRETPERPTLGALKNTGAWAEDATKVCFLWEREKGQHWITTAKNRGGQGTGSGADIPLDIRWTSQTVSEATDQQHTYTGEAIAADRESEPTKRGEEEKAFHNAFVAAVANAGGRPTLRDVADSMSTPTKKYTYKQIASFSVEYKGYQIIAKNYTKTGRPIYSPDDLIEECFITPTPGDVPAAFKYAEKMD